MHATFCRRPAASRSCARTSSAARSADPSSKTAPSSSATTRDCARSRGSPIPRPCRISTSTTPSTASAARSPQTLIDAGNGTTGNAVDPVALAYLKLFPAPNTPGCNVATPTPSSNCLSNNYVISPNKTQSGNSFDVRIDHHFNPNNLFFARYDLQQVQHLHAARPGYGEWPPDQRWAV